LTYNYGCAHANEAIVRPLGQSVATDSAELLGDSGVTESVELELRNCQDMEPAAFTALTTGCAKISGLMAWGLDDVRCQQLRSMPALSCLIVMRSMDFTGQGLQSPPGAICLVFVSCFHIDTDGVRNMVCACSALQTIGSTPEVASPRPEPDRTPHYIFIAVLLDLVSWQHIAWQCLPLLATACDMVQVH